MTDRNQQIRMGRNAPQLARRTLPILKAYSATVDKIAREQHASCSDCTAAHCCHGPVSITLGEAFVIARELKRTGRKLTARAGGGCPLLGPDNRCTVYSVRPIGCREHFALTAPELCDRSGDPTQRSLLRFAATDEARADVARETRKVGLPTGHNLLPEMVEFAGRYV